MDKFLEIYGTLPRAGPGTNALTRRAFLLMKNIPDRPRILDVGCGPGMQTVELLKICNGNVIALDLLPEMIKRAQTEAELAGVSGRLETTEQDMKKMKFPAASFDIIWSEGAIYLLGFENGLKIFKNLVKPGGYIAVSEAVWLKPNPPSEAVEFWAEYPEIDVIEAKLNVIRSIGIELIDYFIFPSTAWTEHYYDPMEKRIAEKLAEWTGDAEGEAILHAAKKEISVYHKYSEFYSYAFFVMRI